MLAKDHARGLSEIEAEAPDCLRRRLSVLQEAFIHKYIELGGKGSATKAMALVRTGQELSSLPEKERRRMATLACLCLKNRHVHNYLAYLRWQLSTAAMVTTTNVLAQKAREAFVDRTAIVAKVKVVDGKVDFSDLTDDERAVIEGGRVRISYAKDGGQDVTVDLDFCPKGVASKTLMEHLGLLEGKAPNTVDRPPQITIIAPDSAVIVTSPAGGTDGQAG